MNYDAATRQTDHRLLGDGAYEYCRTSFDWLRGVAYFARRSWLQSPQTSVVRVERRADTPGGSRQHYCARARCILRSAVGPVAPAWRITAERAAQRRDTASRHARLANPTGRLLHLASSGLLISMCRQLLKRGPQITRKLVTSKFANWALCLCHIGVLGMEIQLRRQ